MGKIGYGCVRVMEGQDEARNEQMRTDGWMEIGEWKVKYGNGELKRVWKELEMGVKGLK